MNKITLGVLALCFSFLNSLTAQVTVGQGDYTSNSVAYPMNFYYGYSYGQSIYLASEINASGDITAISFEMANSNAITSSDDLVNVWIGHTSKTTFETTSDWIDVSTLMQVMSEGSITKSGTTITVTFATPFTYNGDNNLVVAIDLNEEGFDTTGDLIYGTNVGAARTLAYRDDNINPDPADPPFGSRSDYRGNITFHGVSQSCLAPSEVAVANISGTSADVSWTENGTAEEWVIAYGEAGFTLGEGESITATNTTLTLEELTPGTIYDVYVQAQCAEDDASIWVGPFEFSTICDVINDGFTENFDATESGSSSNASIPVCWSYIAEGSASGYVTTTINSVSSPKAIYIFGGQQTGDAYMLISPEISVLNQDYQVSFDAFGYNSVISFGTITDPSDKSTFTEITNFELGNSFETYNVTLPTETTDSYFALKYAGPYYTDLYIDNIVFQPAGVASITDFEESQVSYAPNPVANVLHLKSTNTMQQVTVYNVLGEELIKIPLNNDSYTLAMQKLVSGTYLVQILTIDGRTEVIKIMKN